MKLGRPVKIEPDFKTCTVCKIEQPKENYRLEPRPQNPLSRRNQCNLCRNKLVRERNKKNDIYKKNYSSMTLEQKAAYIKYKSEMNQIRLKTNPKALEAKKLYEKTDKGIYNRYKGDCKRRGRAKRNIELLLTFEEFSSIINSTCTYCGQENCRGIDRIDSSKSYTIENSVPCCKICNAMKNDLSIPDFYRHINKIYKKISQP